MKTFDVTLTPHKSAMLFFKHRYVTIPQKSKAGVDLDSILCTYSVKVSTEILEKYKDTNYAEILTELNSGEHRAEIKNPVTKKMNYHRCFFTVDTMSLFKKLFVSTIVHISEGVKCPETESITFSFNAETCEVIISHLSIYTPENNPYYKYAQRAAVNTSVEAIGLCNFTKEKNKIKNFYDLKNIGKWKSVSQLEKEKSSKDVPGIYMLYNAETNELYIGKAVRLKERIEQHRKLPNDYMRHFTHYRYSVINEEYFEFLYLIENAAIHDIAQILGMPDAKIFKSPLVKISSDIRNCQITNRVEYQTKKQS